MNLFVLSLPALVASVSLSAQAQVSNQATTMAVDQIIARHVEAKGGAAALKAIQSMRSSGRVLIGPMEMVLVTELKRGSFRSDTSIQGMTKTSAFEGQMGWTIDPFSGTGTADAAPMGSDELKQMALQADVEGPLVNYSAKGHRIQCLGKERVNGADAYKLKITLKNGYEFISFLDAKTFLEIKESIKSMASGSEVETEILLGDYRSVSGVEIPFSIEIKASGQPQGLSIVLDKVEVNVPMDDARFKMPSRKG